MAAYRASQTDFSAQQARLVELQRIRSRIATGRMSDEELATWEVEPAPMQAAPAETTQPVVPAVTAPGDSASVEQAAPTPEPQENVAPAVEEQAPPTSESETTPAPDAETAPADSSAPGGEGGAE
jgi:outer membrane biosynthesis protein TonB